MKVQMEPCFYWPRGDQPLLSRPVAVGEEREGSRGAQTPLNKDSGAAR